MNLVWRWTEEGKVSINLVQREKTCVCKWWCFGPCLSIQFLHSINLERRTANSRKPSCSDPNELWEYLKKKPWIMRQPILYFAPLRLWTLDFCLDHGLDLVHYNYTLLNFALDPILGNLAVFSINLLTDRLDVWDDWNGSSRWFYIFWWFRFVENRVPQHPMIWKFPFP